MRQHQHVINAVIFAGVVVGASACATVEPLSTADGPDQDHTFLTLMRVDSAQAAAIPPGAILPYTGEACPPGWQQLKDSAGEPLFIPVFFPVRADGVVVDANGNAGSFVGDNGLLRIPVYLACIKPSPADEESD